MTDRLDPESRAVLALRTAFHRAAFGRTNGRGAPAERDAPAGSSPDLVATAWLLPAASTDLAPSEIDASVSWLLSCADANGAFPDATARLSRVFSTALTFRALFELEKTGQRAEDWTDARTRAGAWLGSVVLGAAPSASVSTSELATVAAAVAGVATLSRTPAVFDALDALTAALSHRLARARTTRERLWCARGLLDVFHETGSRPHLEQVETLVAALGETRDPNGWVAANPGRTDGARADVITQAFFGSLACRIGAPELSAPAAPAIGAAIEATRDDPSGDGGPTAVPVVATSVLLDALFRLVQAASGAMQIPLWCRTPDGEIRTAARRGATRAAGAPHVVFFAQEPHGAACPRIRIDGPLSALRARGAIGYERGSDVSRRYVVLSPAALDRADVLVFQRYFPTRLVGQVAMPVLTEADAARVYDIDDLFFDLPESHPQAAEIREALPAIREAIVRADVVTAPTPFLRDELLRLGAREAHVVPNAIDPDDWTAPDPAARASEADARPVVIGLIGSGSHVEDYRSILPALDALLERHKGGIEIRVWGCAPPELEGREGVRVEPNYIARYRTYAERLSCARIDLALVPLVDHPFNQAKSAIKWMELAAGGVPGIFARVGEYPSIIADGTDGLLAGSDPEEWGRLANDLVADPARRRSIASAAWRNVRERHTFAARASSWHGAISAAVAAREERIARMRARVTNPESRLANPVPIPRRELFRAQPRTCRGSA